MFERVIQDAAVRFGLGEDRARQLLNMTLALIFDPKSKGLPGFITLFQSHGLGEAVTSWIGVGPNVPLSGVQVEQVLGVPAVQAMAGRLNVGVSDMAVILSSAIPLIVDELTKGEVFPVGPGLPDNLLALVGQGAALLRGVPTHAPAPVAHAAPPVAVQTPPPADVLVTARHHDYLTPLKKETNWQWVLVALLVVTIVALLVRDYMAAPISEQLAFGQPDTQTRRMAESETAAPFIDPLLVLSRKGNKVIYGGIVGSEGMRKSIIAALNSSFGDSNVSGDLQVDAHTTTPQWLDAWIKYLPDFRADGAKLTFGDGRVDLSGNVAEADRATMFKDLKARFSSFVFGGLFESVDPAAVPARQIINFASQQELAVELQKIVIPFFVSQTVPRTHEQLVMLTWASELIKRMPPGTHIEISGYTDNVGAPDYNEQVAQARAEAVVDRLVQLGIDPTTASLTAKGYGSRNPAGSNDTPEGRKKNRRVTFTVS